MKYEEAIKRLREICDRLRDEKTPLEESAKLYKEGMELSESCKKMLDGFTSEFLEVKSDE